MNVLLIWISYCPLLKSKTKHMHKIKRDEKLSELSTSWAEKGSDRLGGRDIICKTALLKWLCNFMNTERARPASMLLCHMQHTCFLFAAVVFAWRSTCDGRSFRICADLSCRLHGAEESIWCRLCLPGSCSIISPWWICCLYCSFLSCSLMATIC